MKVLITGAAGQLGSALQQALADIESVAAYDKSALNLEDHDAVMARLSANRPDVVINAAAYTAVDKAEKEEARADSVNHLAVKSLAKQCSNMGLRLIHVSTDFVFDGQKSSPYSVMDETNPLSVYGKTKRLGERALEEYLPDDHVIVRTGWLYSPYGHNFVKTMLGLMKRRNELRVVVDQVGTPTHVDGLARLIRDIISRGAVRGIFHWSDAGVASWYDFAVAIYEEAREIGLIQSKVDIQPIDTQAYPTPAKRPRYSVLDKARAYEELQAPAIHWRNQLRGALLEIHQSGQ